MFPKKRILTPGPTPIADEVRLAMAKPLVHHRTADFEKIFVAVQAQLQHLYQTQNPVIVFAASGTGAMEAAVANTTLPNDPILVIEIGKFGERFVEIARNYSNQVQVIKAPWGQGADLREVELFIQKNPQITAVYFQAVETSTTAKNDVQALAKLIRQYLPNALIVVDAITGLGVFSIPADQWDLDLVVAGSQKALGLPPGLAFISVSPRALQKHQQTLKALQSSPSSPRRSFYFDFSSELLALKNSTTAWTPAINLFYGLHESLSHLQAFGWERLYRRVALQAQAFRQAIHSIGLKTLVTQHHSESATAVMIPDHAELGGKHFFTWIEKNFGFTLANGQDELKNKIFRASHMGYIDEIDTLGLVGALEIWCAKMRNQNVQGLGTAAYLNEWQKILEK